MEPNLAYRGFMGSPKAPGKRQRGEIETLPSGSLRVRVYAGIDPVTRKRHYLTEIIPAGPRATKEAETRRHGPASCRRSTSSATRAPTRR